MGSSPASSAGSVSRIVLEIEIQGKGVISFELIRHLAPITSRTIMNSLPLQGRIHKYGDLFAYFETGLAVGAEKQRAMFKRGEAGFLVSNGSVCIFLKDTPSPTQPMNPLGKVTGDLESTMQSTKPGDVMILRKPVTA
jgi:hypothetical protein